MPTLARLLFIASIASALGGCLFASHEPYPVYGNRVNPTPAAGYRVECRSEPSPGNALFNDYLTACRQVIPPADGPVLRARG